MQQVLEDAWSLLLLYYFRQEYWKSLKKEVMLREQALPIQILMGVMAVRLRRSGRTFGRSRMRKRSMIIIEINLINQPCRIRLTRLRICNESRFVVAVLGKRVHVATQSALEYILGFHFHSLGAFADLVADLGAIVADVVLGFMLAHLLVELLGAVEILLDEDLRVIVSTLGALFAIPVHVVPAKLADNVLKFAHFSMKAKAHVEVRATLVDVAVRAVLALLTALLHKIWAYFEIMTEIALVTIPAASHRFELVAWLYLALVVRIWAVVGQLTLPMDELLAYSVGRQFVVVRRCQGLLCVGWALVLGVVVSRGVVVIWVEHKKIIRVNKIKRRQVDLHIWIKLSYLKMGSKFVIYAV